MSLLSRANALALIIPGALMAGAWGSQLLGGLYPCEMCHWQRWPHYAALLLAFAAFAVKPMVVRRLLIMLAALAILTSGAIGIFHAGVEYKWWEGITPCAAPAAAGGDILKNIMAAPVMSCDQPQWSLFGISLAGYNAIISIMGALGIAALLSRPRFISRKGA